MWIAIVAVFLIGGVIITMTKEMKVLNNKKSNSIGQKTKNINYSNLEHEECASKNIDTCFHIDGMEYSSKRRTCKKCGHHNDFSSRKCSVCGRKLL